MKRMQPQSLSAEIPICLFPSALNFYLDDISSHQRVLKVYNPNEIPLKYRVFCTAIRKYRVVEPEGVIRPHGVVEILIKHREVRTENVGATDKFRVQVYDRKQEVIGRSTATAVLYRTRPPISQQQSQEEKFESIQPSSLTRRGTDSELVTRGARQEGVRAQPRAEPAAARSTNWIVVIAAVLSLIVLGFPLQGDTETSIPEYLHVSHQWKLVAAFFLGLTTWSIFLSTV